MITKQSTSYDHTPFRLPGRVVVTDESLPWSQMGRDPGPSLDGASPEDVGWKSLLVYVYDLLRGQPYPTSD